MRISDWSSDVCSSDLNRNFAKRNDGNPNTHAFVASPEIVTALAIAGDLTFNPITDTLTNENGEQVKLDEPQGIEFPSKGFAVEDNGFVAPAKDGSSQEVAVRPDSDRLQLLEGFKPWEGTDLKGLKRSEERRVGKECVSTGRSRWSQYKK